MKKFILFGLFYCNFYLGGTLVFSQEGLLEFISKQCDSLVTAGILPTLSVGMVYDDKTTTYHSGTLSDGRIPDNFTHYEIASLTKTFTGTLLAYAVHEGKVKLDDDIRNYLSEPFPNLVFDGQSITFRHLVTHTSGLPHMFPNSAQIWENADPDELPFQINALQEGFTRNNFLNELRQVKLDTLPGFKLAYSNAGANLLGICMENLYGKSYPDLVEQYILKPLKMQSTVVVQPNEKRPEVIRGINRNGKLMPLRAVKEINAEGGIVSTVEDMLRYMTFHLNSENTTVHIAHQELFEGRYGNFENGLFWQIYKEEGKPTRIYQNGGAFGTSSWMTLIPERNTGILLITNISGPDVHQILNVLVEKILEYPIDH